MNAKLVRLVNVVGEVNVFSDAATLKTYARTTGFRPIEPLAVVRPDSTAQVAQVVAIANEVGLKLYPISKGKNWGYGDAAPARAEQVVVDLSRMDRILEVNTELCYAVVEPGVTQGQLSDYLKANHPSLWTDATGAGKACSIVGNFSDRGFGHTRYSDHYLSAAQLQVVLGSGEVLETGAKAFAGSRVAETYKWGIGPILDGLFSQSNFGIITRLTLNLMPAPADYCVYTFSLQSDEELATSLRVLSQLRLQGIIQSAVHIVNDLRAVSGKMRYPWEAMLGATPLSEDVRRSLQKAYRLARWTGTGIITGRPNVVKALKACLQEELGPYHPRFFSRTQLSLLSKVSHFAAGFKAASSLTRQVELIGTVASMLRGQPSDEALPGALWRVRAKPAMDSVDPLDHQAGIAWLSPLLPMRANEMRTLLSTLPGIYHKHGFDFLGTFTLINERSLVLVSNVAFDRALPAEINQAQACYDEALDTLFKLGFMPYRLDPRSSSKLAKYGGQFWRTVGHLKRALDPNNVISPGRYDPLDGADATPAAEK